MKYKENKLALYSVLGGFALAGILFTTQVVSLNSLHVWPIFQLIALPFLLYLGKKMFLTSKIASFLILLLFFIMVMDLTNLMPALFFLIFMGLHKITGLGDAMDFETLFKLKPVFFLMLSLPFYKGLTLIANVLLGSKRDEIYIQDEKSLGAKLPSSNAGKEYDLITAGAVVFSKATETITINARNLENLVDFSFVLRDKRNSILGLSSGSNIITAKNCYLSNNGEFLFIEKSIKPFFKARETFVYVLHLQELNETIKTKIYQYLRFEVNANNEPLGISNNNANVYVKVPAMVEGALTFPEVTALSENKIDDTSTISNDKQDEVSTEISKDK